MTNAPGFLISPQGKTEYSAAFVVGEAGAAKLTPGQWYTPRELFDLCGRVTFVRESPGCGEKNVTRWRYERAEA